MKDKSKLKKALLASVALLLVISTVLFVSDYKERFEVTEKNIIAMGTVVSEKIYSKENAGKHIDAIGKIINGLEDKISWRKDGSAVATLNSEGKVSDTAVANALEIINEVSSRSEGAFDVTIGEITRLWSIGEEDERIPAEEEIKDALKKVDYTSVKVEGTVVTVPEGVQIDLGAIGKGYACDLLKEYLERTEAEGAVVSVGGSILAHGRYNKAGDKWKIAVRHPRNENEFLGILSIDEGFVSTSGDYERYFEKDGKRYHHIIDANTGYPAETPLISVTVVCDSGILSDALSTACFIVGEEKSKDILEAFDAKAIFVYENMTVSTRGEIDFEKQ